MGHFQMRTDDYTIPKIKRELKLTSLIFFQIFIIPYQKLKGN